MNFNVNVIVLSQYTPSFEGYTYIWDSERLGIPQVGMRVEIPFGRVNKVNTGLIITINKEAKEERQYKEVIASLDTFPILSREDLEFANWLQKHFFINLYQIFQYMLPPGNPKDYAMIDSGKPHMKVYKSITVDKMIRLTETGKSSLENITNRAYKQREVISYLLKKKTPVLRSELVKELEVKSYLLNRLVELNYIEVISAEKISQKSTLELSEVQDKVYRNILSNADKNHIINGVTGSGKTAIYVQLGNKIVQENKILLVIVAEIGLISQMKSKMLEYFPGRVSVIHSDMALGLRQLEWSKVYNHEVDVVIGTRSAIMVPFDNIGMVIIDEMHDSAFEVMSGSYFNVLECAEYRCKKQKIPLVMGSATPKVSYWYRGKKGNFQIHQLSSRYGNASLAEVRVVDMRKELLVGNTSIFSRELEKELGNILTLKEQALLFLNRRGFSTFISCRSCGHVMKCPDCEIPLTFHKSRNRLICHTCGYTERTPRTCPVCRSHKIKYFGIGTEQVAALTSKQFPQAQITRMDRDSTSTRGKKELIVKDMKNKKTDILIGTQMITKGHDFPDVTLVGILAADLALNQADFTAPEKTFQLIVQAAGRAGRANKPGLVCLQTYEPDHYSIQHGKNQDFDAFYHDEIAIRKVFKYPPFYEILRIEYESTKHQDKEIKAVHQQFISKMRENFSEEFFEVYPIALDSFQSNDSSTTYYFESKWDKRIANEVNEIVYTIFKHIREKDLAMKFLITRW